MARIIDNLLLSWSFDATTEEQYEDSTEWTDHPVESGLPVSDHAIDQPVRVTLAGVVSESVAGIPGAVPLPDRARQAYDRLLSLKARHQLVTVVTGLRVLQNMGIEKVNLARDARTGLAVHPTVELKEVRLVASVTVPVPPEILKAEAKAAGQTSNVDAGKQTGASPDAATSAAGNRTMLASADDYLKGTGSPGDQLSLVRAAMGGAQ